MNNKTKQSKKIGLISIDLEDFTKEVLPRTVKGYYKGNTNKEKYADFKQKHPDMKGLFTKSAVTGERIAIRFY